MSKFLDSIKEKVLIFDGAMGTSIHEYDLSLDDYAGRENCPEILVETRPDVVSEIHEAYLKVGCDAVETDTREWPASSGLSFWQNLNQSVDYRIRIL